MSLRQTLQTVIDQAEKQNEFDARKPQFIAEWQDAVRWLNNQLQTWLAEYVQDGSITFAKEMIELREETLGSYSVEAMNINAGPIVVRVQPTGRMIVAAAGRVDMYRQGRSSDGDRILFLRLDADRIDAWGMRLPLKTGPRPHVVGPLTKETFESALESLLV